MWPLPNGANCENLFSGIAELEIVGGGVAETEELVGFMDYSIAPCLQGASCDVTVNKIHAWTSTVNGVYSLQDASGAWSSVPFVINDLEARTLQPFVGQLNPSTGIVTFAGEELFATASTSAVLLDGAGLSTGLTDAAYVVERISGSVVGGELTLELEWGSPSGDVSLYLQLSSQ
ncbi:hypothetical protein OV203_37620 [Nannocystis sp. ILAH1]|nr:hypothetical protein [Nannocystis sp. ILAH1]MCY0992921.1 hypothetical protein [Nannocystis sp. ILAH1]